MMHSAFIFPNWNSGWELVVMKFTNLDQDASPSCSLVLDVHDSDVFLPEMWYLCLGSSLLGCVN